MSRLSLLAVVLLACPAARAFEPGSMPSLDQAESIGDKGAGTVYDNSSSRGGVKAKEVDGGKGSDVCADETCGFRRGGPPPASLRKEPETPFTGDINPDGTNKKSGAGKFTWKTVAVTLVGAAAGAAIGYFVGGPIGAVIGGVVGALLGLLLNLFS